MSMVDQGEPAEFTERVIGDLAVAMHAATVVIGLRLGLYRTMAEAGPATPAEVAAAADCDERYVIEWLAAQAAAGYCEYDEDTGRFSLSGVQQACLEQLAAGQLMVSSVFKNEAQLAEAIRTGSGHPGPHTGFTGYSLDSWIPALDGVAAELTAGATVADVGCGHGASTIQLATAFPASRFVGFDPHRPSVETARKAAVDAGVGDRVSFEVASAADFPGTGYDLICVLDALHGMGDPVGAAAHIRSALAAGGTWLLVEPMAGESLADNIGEVGRLFYAMSTLVCVPSARAQPGGWALGAQASEGQLRGLCRRAGFTSFRRAAQSRLHRVFEVRV